MAKTGGNYLRITLWAHAVAGGYEVETDVTVR